MNNPPENIGRRFGDLSTIPEEVMSQLVSFQWGDFEEGIVACLKTLEGIATLDELMVAMFRRDRTIRKRSYYVNRLYKMLKEGKIYTVPKRRGVYALTADKTERSVDV